MSGQLRVESRKQIPIKGLCRITYLQKCLKINNSNSIHLVNVFDLFNKSSMLDHAPLTNLDLNNLLKENNLSHVK